MVPEDHSTAVIRTFRSYKTQSSTQIWQANIGFLRFLSGDKLFLFRPSKCVIVVPYQLDLHKHTWDLWAKILEVNFLGNRGIKVRCIVMETWVSLASDPLFVKKALAILLAVNMSRRSLARSCFPRKDINSDQILLYIYQVCCTES